MIAGMGELIGAARAKAGTATQGNGSFIMYWLLGMYFIPKDANEVWERLGVKASLVWATLSVLVRRTATFRFSRSTKPTLPWRGNRSIHNVSRHAVGRSARHRS